MPVADPHQAALRDALLRAAPGHFARARRRAVQRRMVFALIFALAVIASIVTVALPDDRADAGIDVRTRDGLVYARLLDIESRPDEIVAALRSAGINASVDLVPVGPSNVGRFVGSRATQTASITVVDGDAYSFKAFSINEGYRGELVLELGRLAAEGEQWRGASNAMAKDEALSCLNLYDLTPPDAIHALSGVHASVRWMDARHARILDAGEELRAPYANWRVIDALSLSPGDVVIRLTVDGSWPLLNDPPPKVDPSCKGR
jgi:hypothetical protein